MGASFEFPGLSGVHTHMTNSLNTPLEALEKYLPLKIRRYCLRKNSGGRGEKRGGDGIIREYEFLVPTQVTIISERRKFSPYGISGGKDGKKGKNTLFSGDKKFDLGSKVNIKARPGDVLRIETPGGGGYGIKK
jgi:N-methylhydantoinase B/oxoprolinase/acetone carboxylase alpha subunit